MTVIDLNPFFSANIYIFSAQANLLLQRMDLAELHAREAVGMDDAHRLSVAHRLLARILSNNGNLTEAMQQLQSCLTHTPAGPEAEMIKKRNRSSRREDPPTLNWSWAQKPQDVQRCQSRNDNRACLLDYGLCHLPPSAGCETHHSRDLLQHPSDHAHSPNERRHQPHDGRNRRP
jgi:hypothetical protein